MKNVITISRETGSGGHTIGQMLAERLGYQFYDGEIVDRIAEKGNCVIVGRNADEILKENPNAFHIFIHANMEHRIARVMRHESTDRADSREKNQIMCGNVAVSMEDETATAKENRIRHELELKDKTRAAHYNYFTNRTWGMVSNYNLMVDTSLMTKTQCCELILDALKK